MRNKHFVLTLLVLFLSGLISAQTQRVLNIYHSAEIDSIKLFGVEYELLLTDSLVSVSFERDEPLHLFFVVRTNDEEYPNFRVWYDKGTAMRSLYFDSQGFSLPDSLPIDKEYASLKSIEQCFRDGECSEEEYDRYWMDYYNTKPESYLSLLWLHMNVSRLSIPKIDSMLAELQEFEYMHDYKRYKDVVNYRNALEQTQGIQSVQFLGDSFVDFSYLDFEQQVHSTDSINSEYIFLYFWFQGCQHCKTTDPVLEELYHENVTQHDLTVISYCTSGEESFSNIAQQDVGDYWLPAMNKEGYSHPVPLIFDLKAYPSLMVFKDRQLIARYTDANTVVEMLKDFEF